MHGICFTVISICVFLLHMSYGITAAASAAAVISVIPKPAKMTPLGGAFSISQETVILTDEHTDALGEYAQELFSPVTGLALPVMRHSGKPSGVGRSMALLLTQDRDDLGEEGYTMSVRADGVVIRAGTPTGIFYGIQTLRQLLPPEIERRRLVDETQTWSIPCVEIEDIPRFSWRGLMLDCSRTFLSKDYIMRTIRLMALYKLNRLQLHLTDDQGWRVEIRKYPKLTTVGSKFAERYEEPPERQGYYSQADIRQMVAYGTRLGVSIIPEIEMPGHSLALLACYPELSCTGGQFEIHPFFWGPNIHKDILCAGNEKTFQVMEDILSEVIELFPSSIIHVGGDEAPKDRWKACPKCQARMQQEGLHSEEDLQSYFMKRIAVFLKAKGKQLVGWEEILQGGLAPDAIVMSWRSMDPGINAAKAGHDVVMCPRSHCYFDYENWTISTMKSYEFEPVPREINQEQARHILGAQACFWSHIDRTEAVFDRQLFPRLLSIAEIAWSAMNARDPTGFRERVQLHLRRLDELGVRYYPDPTILTEESH